MAQLLKQILTQTENQLVLNLFLWLLGGGGNCLKMTVQTDLNKALLMSGVLQTLVGATDAELHLQYRVYGV
jgi:hypothetical protein